MRILGTNYFFVDHLMIHFFPDISFCSNPNCRAFNPRTKRDMIRSESTFAVSCPIAGPSIVPTGNDEIAQPKEITQLVGAPVFDMNGLVVGTIDCADPVSYNLKFGIKTSFFLDKLEMSLKELDQQVTLCYLFFWEVDDIDA